MALLSEREILQAERDVVVAERDTVVAERDIAVAQAANAQAMLSDSEALIASLELSKWSRRCGRNLPAETARDVKVIGNTVEITHSLNRGDRY
ncbi:hypothetical protein CN200_35115 [Sinorhizobium meliloti]|uniref:hypothetical protein n=1 Tax=Rhizobium meliloti TaxID=382 RepID=UPI000FD52C00|nr:hypothetical protein [Sinorhizobium meliloti]RVI01421.1 hypothetical protein CN200_35115 [Sinorhizobium meliloti]RVN77554.1 hypothetical protein CN107_35020 [Sinorhizobium meliloti]RVN97545.1 hypothetical protein CN103_35085 [Sinorhizobium meliloti]